MVRSAVMSGSTPVTVCLVGVAIVDAGYAFWWRDGYWARGLPSWVD